MRLLPSSPRRSVEDLPPSAKFLLRVLEERGSATSSSLAAQTGLPLRTIQHALKILREHDLVEIAIEARRRIYKLKS
jgi:DNA-binding transcriptional ArsR family regulator